MLVVVCYHLAYSLGSHITVTNQVMLDSCCSHLHHRTKLVIRPLKKHTMAHFRIANLTRLYHIREATVDRVEDLVSDIIRTTDVPPGGHTLLVFVDIFVDLDADHHKRKHGKDTTAIHSLMHYLLLTSALMHWVMSRHPPCPHWRT